MELLINSMRLTTNSILFLYCYYQSFELMRPPTTVNLIVKGLRPLCVIYLGTFGALTLAHKAIIVAPASSPPHPI